MSIGLLVEFERIKIKLLMFYNYVTMPKASRTNAKRSHSDVCVSHKQ